ncbi:MAG: ribonuclease III [Bacillota bacterium]|nr:ribonuclease III [Bacillota bacterium]
MEYTEIAGYKFNNPDLLKMALTHTSYSNEKRQESNQRLEFLGDSVIGLVIGEYIYTAFPAMPEGELTKIRAGIVCEKGLVRCAEKINLGNLLRLGRGEEISGGRTRSSNIEDAFEAVVGAVFLDSDFYATKDFVLSVMKDIISETVAHDGIEDSKTALQEYCQQEEHCTVEYNLIKEEGPDHAKKYTIEVLINGKKEGEGIGNSKKDAEQAAAKSALKKLQVNR